MKKVTTKSEAETIKLGQNLAKQFKGGEILCLYGELGAGKTTLIKGIGLGLGIKKIITSPTFVLMKVYKISDFRFQISDLVHIDCYRIDGAQAIEDIGATEYFGRADTVVVIEWPERIREILPKKALKVYLKHAGVNKRRVLVEGVNF